MTDNWMQKYETTNTWNKVYTTTQKNKLVEVTSKALDDLIKSSQNFELINPIIINEAYSDTLKKKFTTPIMNWTDELFLSNRGLEEKVIIRKRKIITYLSTGTKNVSEANYAKVVEKYKLTPTAINELKKSIEKNFSNDLNI
jgi:hypothetical protein